MQLHEGITHPLARYSISEIWDIWILYYSYLIVKQIRVNGPIFESYYLTRTTSHTTEICCTCIVPIPLSPRIKNPSHQFPYLCSQTWEVFLICRGSSKLVCIDRHDQTHLTTISSTQLSVAAQICPTFDRIRQQRSLLCLRLRPVLRKIWVEIIGM